MDRPTVVILDYGSGNVHSAARALEAAGAAVSLSADPGPVARAHGLVVPGVGAFSAVMAALEQVDGAQLIDRRLAGGKPVLGVCVGMQILFGTGTERGVETPGLEQWPGHVRELRSPILPHMGWNTVQAPTDSTLFEGVGHERFYFLHSNAATQWHLASGGPIAPARCTWSAHGEPFLAAVENGPLAATQFHPEKSGAAGLRVLSNWVATLHRD